MNRDIKAYLFITIVLLGNTLFAQETGSKGSQPIKIDFGVIQKNKNELSKQAGLKKDAYDVLIKNANKLLLYKPVSVMDKKQMPVSGDKHDYMSIAPYWWPDPSKPNGIPYIRRDGEFNPEINDYTDKDNMPKLCENIYFLSLAYYFSSKEEYASHATELIRVWFLDSATKMNPNLNFGQSIKGITDGRGAGLIDARHFIFLLDGVQLLQQSTSWNASLQIQLQKWFSEYITWLQTSKVGMEELNANNNHGVWYDAQSLSIALFIKDTVLAKKIIERAIGRLDKQQNNEGFFQMELDRTTSFHYSTFILNAFTIIAQESEQIGVDFWNVKTASGKSLQKAYDAMLPYYTKQKNWDKGKQISPFKYSETIPIFFRAGKHYSASNYLALIQNITGDKNNISLHQLL